MAQTTPWAALYFIALMTFGNYVLFNLLVAILVEGFQESKEEEKRTQEEEAKKLAIVEEEQRRRELEQIMSDARLEHGDGGELDAIMASEVDGAECTCQEDATGNAAALARTMSERAPARMTVRVARGANELERPGTDETLAAEERSAVDAAIKRRMSLDVRPDGALVGGHRDRQGSWTGASPRGAAPPPPPVVVTAAAASVRSPICPKHGRRALLEAYARRKYLQVPLREVRTHNAQNCQAQAELAELKAAERAAIDAAAETAAEEAAGRSSSSLCGRLFRRVCCCCAGGSRADYSLGVFSPRSWIRRKCVGLVTKKWFDWTVLAFIGVNCITLAMERPSIPPDSTERWILIVSGYVFTVIFTAEMMLKIIAWGCCLGPGAYFKDGWNVLDGLLVVISLVSIFFEMFVSGDSPKIFGVIRVLRLLRALRPLRVINRAPGVKLVVMTLISSLKPIGNIVLICCTFFIIFGILGVQLFKGMLYHCIGPDISNVTTKAECLEDPRNKWVNHRYNFDNLGQALMSLFVLSSKDGWVSLMFSGIDAVGVDMQPVENFNEWRMIYFISFLLLVGFFVLNMFVGVVVENFHKCKEALEAEMMEKAKQKQLERKLKQKQYDEYAALKKKKEKAAEPYWTKYSPNRLFLHGVITSKYFDLAIAAVIGINVISMAIEFYMMPMGLKYVLKGLNYFFTAVFTLEAAMKLYALGLRRFFKERWNQLDLLIVFLSIAGIVFEEFEALELPINPTIIRVMRVLRIARVLKLLKMAKGIRSLLDTVGEALPQVGNLGSLFFLLFFIFAALGVELFGRLECSEEHPCDGLGEHAHFKNFGMAFLTLFRIATGDNWNGIMKDALRDDCDASARCETNCCVDPILAPCFFVLFVLISQFVLVNVVVAVLMKHLEESNKRDAETNGGDDPNKSSDDEDESPDDKIEAEGEQQLALLAKAPTGEENSDPSVKALRRKPNKNGDSSFSSSDDDDMTATTVTAPVTENLSSYAEPSPTGGNFEESLLRTPSNHRRQRRLLPYSPLVARHDTFNSSATSSPLLLHAASPKQYRPSNGYRRKFMGSERSLAAASELSSLHDVPSIGAFEDEPSIMMGAAGGGGGDHDDDDEKIEFQQPDDVLAGRSQQDGSQEETANTTATSVSPLIARTHRARKFQIKSVLPSTGRERRN